MNYNTLLDLATDLGYYLAMCGAETFRVEDSVTRILSAYKIESEVFVIPNCMIVSIETTDGKSMTRMRRIGHHGNDLDGVERYNNLSRRICSEKPDPKEAIEWLKEASRLHFHYSFPVCLLGDFVCAFGFAILFGGSLIDAVCAGLGGILIGLVNRFLNTLKVNPFFRTIAAAFIMALMAYILGAWGITNNTDAVIIGALMLLVPGLLFTNALRDIIYGDINSGTNRIVQVLLVAAAIALGTGAAMNLSSMLFTLPVSAPPVEHTIIIQLIACFLGCIGFSIMFNIRMPGVLFCALGGVLSWAGYCLILHIFGHDIPAYFISALISAAYSEAMARIRKYPAISYLVIAIIALIPGASIYYTANHLVQKNMEAFASTGTHTIAIAGAIAVGILMVSTIVQLTSVWRSRKKKV